MKLMMSLSCVYLYLSTQKRQKKTHKHKPQRQTYIDGWYKHIGEKELSFCSCVWFLCQWRYDHDHSQKQWMDKTCAKRFLFRVSVYTNFVYVVCRVFIDFEFWRITATSVLEVCGRHFFLCMTKNKRKIALQKFAFLCRFKKNHSVPMPFRRFLRPGLGGINKKKKLSTYFLMFCNFSKQNFWPLSLQKQRFNINFFRLRHSRSARELHHNFSYWG